MRSPAANNVAALCANGASKSAGSRTSNHNFVEYPAPLVVSLVSMGWTPTSDFWYGWAFDGQKWGDFRDKKRLTEFSNCDPKPSKSGNRPVDSAGFGRPSELADEEWLRRYESIRSFLQVEWGKIGYQLKRVQSREEVVALFEALQNRGSREKPVERIVELLTTP